MSTLNENNDTNLNKIIRKTETKGVMEIVDDAQLQDYITHHNRPNGFVDCKNGQHHFIAVGDSNTKQDIISCSSCNKKLVEHLNELRDKRELRRQKKDMEKIHTKNGE